MAFAQHTRNSSSVSQNMSQDDSCHNDRVDVSLHLTPQDRSLVTGYWWWWMVPGLVTSSIWWLPVLAPGPGTVKTSATNNQSSARPAHAHITLPPLPLSSTYNDGTGPGLGLVRARQSPEYWSDLGGGGGCHQTSFILACITGCIHSDQNMHEINYLHGKCATHLSFI